MQLIRQRTFQLWIAAVVFTASSLAGRDAVAAEASTESTLFPGHGSTIAALAITPDGQTLATGSLDNNIKLWNLPSCKERITLRGHPGGIQGMALTREGDLLASTSHDDFVKIWATKNGLDKGTIKTGYRVWSVAFSPDGQTVVTAGQAPIKVWEVATGRERMSLDPGLSKSDHKTLLSTSLAVTADGKTLCAGYTDGTIRLWDLTTGQVRTILRSGPETIFSLVLSPDDRTLACMPFMSPVTLWDIASGKRRGRLPGGGAKAAHCIAFSPSGRLLATGGLDGQIRLWDAYTNKQRTAFRAHSDGAVFSLAFSPDGKTLYSGGGRELQRGDVKRFDISSYETAPASK